MCGSGINFKSADQKTIWKTAHVLGVSDFVDFARGVTLYQMVSAVGVVHP